MDTKRKPNGQFIAKHNKKMVTLGIRVLPEVAEKLKLIDDYPEKLRKVINKFVKEQNS